MERELPDTKVGFRKDRGTKDHIANLRQIIEKSTEFRKGFIDYLKAFDCVDHEKLFITLTEIGLPTHLIVLMRELYSDQGAAVKTPEGTTE